MRQALGAVLPGQQPCISWCCKPAALIRAQSAQHLLLSQTRTDCSVISSKQPRCSHQKLPQRLSHLPQWNSNAAATQQAVATELAAVSSQHRQQTGGELSLSHLGLAPLGWTGSLLVASAVRGCSLLFTALRKTQGIWKAVVKAAKSWTPDDPWAAAIVLVISVLVTVLASSLVRLQQQQSSETSPGNLAQRAARARQMEQQRRRIACALDSGGGGGAAVGSPPPQGGRLLKYAEILDDYRQVLDTSTPSLNVDGVPVGESLANPMYWDDPELEREWKDFVLGTKMSLVQEDAWWDAADAQLASKNNLPKVDDIDWNS